MLQSQVFTMLAEGDCVICAAPWSRMQLAKVYSDWERFFFTAEKNEFRHRPGQLSGYFGYRAEHAIGATQPDPKEFFHVYQDSKLPPMIGPETKMLLGSGTSLARRLLSEFQSVMPADTVNRLATPLDALVGDGSRVVLRVTWYPRASTDHQTGEPAAAAHKDIDLLTLLPPATDAGLEILRGRGRWVPVAPSRDQVLVLAGELLEIASAGSIVGSTHRVVATTTGKPRLSLNIFINPPDQARVFKDTTAGDILKKRLADIGYST